MKKARNSNPTNTRFEESTLDELRAVAALVNVTVSDLVRLAVSQKLPEWKESGIVTFTMQGRK
jgi:hypothetical protein